MRAFLLASAILSSAFAPALARAADFSADIPKLREFLDLDKSYSPPERAEAEAAFAKLKAAAPNMSRAAFGRFFGAREGKRDEWVGFIIESPELMHEAGLAATWRLKRCARRSRGGPRDE